MVTRDKEQERDGGKKEESRGDGRKKEEGRRRAE